MTALSFVWVHPYSQNSRCDNNICKEAVDFETVIEDISIVMYVLVFHIDFDLLFR